MLRNCIIFIFFVVSYSAISQGTSLKGKIITGHLENSSINIINLSKEMGTTNNTEGEFEIPVTVNDTLLFSSIQYEPREIVITEEILKKEFITVLLVEKIDELKEVNISDINLSGNIATDLKNIPTLTQADLGFPMSDAPRLTSIERKLKTASNLSTSSPDTPPGVKASLDGILNRINGKTAKLLKAAANEDLSQTVDAGVAALPGSFFTELAIPQNRIRDFVYFCAENQNFSALLVETKRFDLIEYYQLKAPQYLRERL